jgi:hypothetical protein
MFGHKETVTLRDPDRIWGPEQLRDETGLEAGLRLAQTSASRPLGSRYDEAHRRAAKVNGVVLLDVKSAPICCQPVLKTLVLRGNKSAGL